MRAILGSAGRGEGDRRSFLPRRAVRFMHGHNIYSWLNRCIGLVEISRVRMPSIGLAESLYWLGGDLASSHAFHRMDLTLNGSPHG